MQAQRVPQTQNRTSSRPYHAQLKLHTYQIYSGEILEFNSEFIEFKFRPPRLQRHDVMVVFLSDPRLRAIFGDPNGGPCTVILEDDNILTNYNDRNSPLRGTITAVPHDMLRIDRPGSVPAFLKSAYSVIRNPEEMPNTAADQRRQMARGKVGGKVMPKQMPSGKGLRVIGKSTPPPGSPAAEVKDSNWG